MVKDCRDCEYCGVFVSFMRGLGDKVVCGYNLLMNGPSGLIDPKTAAYECRIYHPIDARIERYDELCETLNKTADEIDTLTSSNGLNILDVCDMLKKVRDTIRNEPQVEANKICTFGGVPFGYMRN